MIEIETPRLLLRRLQEKDKQDLFEILCDEQWCLDGGGYHAMQALDEQFGTLFHKFLEQRRYAVVLKEKDKVIGLVSMVEANRAVPAYELGFGINTSYQRKGYCYEAVKSVIDICFQQTDIQMFTVSHYSYNTASQKLVCKLGFIYEGTLHNARHHSVFGPSDLMCYYLER